MIICGVDPGLSGAVALIDSEQKRVLMCLDMPTKNCSLTKKKKSRAAAAMGKMVEKPLRVVDGYALFSLLGDVVSQVDVAVVEHVVGMPGQSSVAGFTFGKATGRMEGVFDCLEIPIVYAHPARWKKHFKLPGKKEKDADQAPIALAMELYPELGFTRKKDHGMAEAVLMAHWYIETVLGASDAVGS